MGSFNGIPETEISACLSSLSSLTDENLELLLENDELFEEFFRNNAQVQAWEAEKDKMMLQNKEIAEFNLTFEPKLREGKAALMDLYEKARASADEVETRRALLQSLSNQTSLETTHALLQASLAEAEEASEALGESFLDGSIELETFLADFFTVRTMAHLRKVKVDKMGELTNKSRAGTFSGSLYQTKIMSRK